VAVANVIPPQKAAAIAARAGVADRTGWCPVEPVAFESTLQPGIHVLGDAALMGGMSKSAFAAAAQGTACAAAIVARLAGRTIDAARAEILADLENERAVLDSLTAKIVAEGLATLAQPGGIDEKVLIVRGTAHLLDSVEAQADIERIRTLFDDIERKADLIRLLELAKAGDGVSIFIGSENRLFSLSGSSIVAAPYANAAGKIVGVIGVLGPTRLNYGRIIPMVDHTAKVIGRLLG